MKRLSEKQADIMRWFWSLEDKSESKLLPHDADQRFKNSIRRLVQKRKLELVKIDEQGEWYKLT